MPEYIARISYGKDSLKMLDVIFTRDLPLDRITTTDVWATDTISANLPPMEEFKARMDERIWNLYRVDVEHLCARNKDGSKKTYEQMFYHVPVRRSQTVQVEREREPASGRARSTDSQLFGANGVKLSSKDLPEYRIPGSIKGFPGICAVNWCQKLKLVPDTGIPSADIPMVQKTQDRQGQDTAPRRAPHEAREKKYRGIPGDRCGRACPVWPVECAQTRALGRVRHS